MTGYFIGGTLGSIGAAATYASFGWDGPAGLGAAFGGLAFLISLTGASLPAAPNTFLIFAHRAAAPSGAQVSR